MATPAAGGGLETRHYYILVAFMAGFIAVAVVTIAFVVLSPARISFSVTSAASHDDVSGGGLQLNFTIVANNTSRRAVVRYLSLSVDVSNNTGLQWVHSVRAEEVATAMPLRQPPRNVTEIHAAAHLVGGPFTEDFTGNKTSHRFSVRITTVARFKVGVAWTRLYAIRIYCLPVDFFANKSSTADCHGGA